MSTKNLEIVEDDLKFPAEPERDRAGLGNGSPVEPSSASPIGLSRFRHSAAFGNLCKALCAASQEFPEITKDTENPYFRSQYADLATLIKATRPALAKHGLFVVQAPQSTSAGILITTMLMHTSGEWLASDLELPSVKQDAQGKGSAITYARRYSYQAILNIAAEEDDDGNAATGKTQQDRQSRSTEVGPGRINPVQMRSFQSACKTGGKTLEQANNYIGGLGYETLEELPKAKLDDAIKWALGK
jgi:ERF superfamily